MPARAARGRSRQPPFDPVAVHFFFFNDTATTEIYTLSLHDALPIWECVEQLIQRLLHRLSIALPLQGKAGDQRRSEEHTSELQSQSNLVCRLLLEQKHHSCAPSRPPAAELLLRYLPAGMLSDGPAYV